MDQVYRVERERDGMANGSPTSHEAPLFFNELGVTTVEIGVVDFHCMGVLPPHDHPHVYLNMGDQAELLCPYCSTEYRFNPALRWNETTPANCWAAGPRTA
jgi:uncharacterized Zn-finger protein